MLFYVRDAHEWDCTKMSELYKLEDKDIYEQIKDDDPMAEHVDLSDEENKEFTLLCYKSNGYEDGTY